MLRIFSYLRKDHKLKVISGAMSLIITASILSGGIFFALNKVISAQWVTISIAYLIGLSFILVAKLIIVSKYKKRQKRITLCIRKLGEGQVNPTPPIAGENIFPDIAQSVNHANSALSSRLKSIANNTRRLSYLEEELSYRFRPSRTADKNLANLIYQLKICTSRLRNDLNEFSVAEEEKINQ